MAGGGGVLRAVPNNLFPTRPQALSLQLQGQYALLPAKAVSVTARPQCSPFGEGTPPWDILEAASVGGGGPGRAPAPLLRVLASGAAHQVFFLHPELLPSDGTLPPPQVSHISFINCLY